MIEFPRPISTNPAFAHYRPARDRVYGIICQAPSNRILLVRGRQTGKWSFPKGHLKQSEHAHDCALREMREETGITLERYQFHSIRKFSNGEYFVYTLPEETDANPEDCDEVEAVGWFSLADMQDMNCNSDIKQFLRRRIRHVVRP